MEDKNHLKYIRPLASQSDTGFVMAELANQSSQKRQEKTGDTFSRANYFLMLLNNLHARDEYLMPALIEISRRHRVPGFSTFGEQFNKMHINQLITGITIGNRIPVS